MIAKEKYDAVIVGSGPNGLAAAITLARAGLSVVIFEGYSTPGGGLRSAELTLPGFTHDICSAIHPLAAASPFFTQLPLDKFGLEWIYPETDLAHPFDDGTAVLLKRSIDATAGTLGSDYNDYKKLMEPLAAIWDKVFGYFMDPIRFPPHPFAAARFGLKAVLPASVLIKKFNTEKTKAFFAGMAAHSILPLNTVISGGFGLVLSLIGHKGGWPIPKGGSQSIADALVSYFKSLGGELHTGNYIKDIEQLPPSRFLFFDITPAQILEIAGSKLPQSYINRLKKYEYGPGIFKVDFALNAPVPWKSPEVLSSPTVHLGGSSGEIITSEMNVWKSRITDRPYVLAAQQSLFDSSRAPEGKHTLWAYCHVPNDVDYDMTENIIKQIVRFAPGFRDTIIKYTTANSEDIEEYNPNYVGGDINGGAQHWKQFLSRPVLSFNPYALPVKGWYICSSASPPGGGVHGMSGYNAARRALKTLN